MATWVTFSCVISKALSSHYSFSYILYDFIYHLFIVIQLKVFSNFSCAFSFDSWVFISELLNFPHFQEFSSSSFKIYFCLNSMMIREHTLNYFNSSNLWILASWPWVGQFWKMFHVYLKRMCTCYSWVQCFMINKSTW